MDALRADSSSLRWREKPPLTNNVDRGVLVSELEGDEEVGKAFSMGKKLSPLSMRLWLICPDNEGKGDLIEVADGGLGGLVRSSDCWTIIPLDPGWDKVCFKSDSSE